jgi:hypothetical protein
MLDKLLIDIKQYLQNQVDPTTETVKDLLKQINLYLYNAEEINAVVRDIVSEGENLLSSKNKNKVELSIQYSIKLSDMIKIIKDNVILKDDAKKASIEQCKKIMDLIYIRILGLNLSIK